jgi:hypothetical protein
MKTTIDQQKLKKQTILAHTASLGGFFLVMASVALPLFLPGLRVVFEILLFVGVLISMVGIVVLNRWVRKPRPEDSLGEALKTLGEGYHLFHYTNLPARHVLVMPNGVIVFETFNLAGEFSYTNGRWKEKMNLGRIIRYPFEEHLGDPSRRARLAVDDLKAQLQSSVGVVKSVQVSGVVVFIHPLAQVEARGAPVTVCKVDKLRKTVVIKAPKIDPQVHEQIADFLEKHTLGIS